MKTCEICNEKKGERIIAGMSICNNCFARLQGLRNGNEDDLLFFRDSINVSKFSQNAKEYIDEVATDIEKSHRTAEEIIIERKRMQEDEMEKQEYARSLIGLYEYAVETILNEDHGCVDAKRMTELINKRAREGWKLHTVYSNELGKNALKVLGLVENSTACEDVLVFERKLMDK